MKEYWKNVEVHIVQCTLVSLQYLQKHSPLLLSFAFIANFFLNSGLEENWTLPYWCK